MPDNRGLYGKFTVERTDGKEKPNARYFVLNYADDPAAREALRTYAFYALLLGKEALHDELHEALDEFGEFDWEPYYA